MHLEGAEVAGEGQMLVRVDFLIPEKQYLPVEKGLSKGLDVPTLVEKKVAAFSVAKLETLILEVASRELRAIEVLGGVLGVLIGLAQVGFLLWHGQAA